MPASQHDTTKTAHVPLFHFQNGNFTEIRGKEAAPQQSPASPPSEEPPWGSRNLLPWSQGSITCENRTEKYLRSSALNTSEMQQRPWEAQSGGSPLPKELQIKKKKKRCPCKKGGCSQYELQYPGAPRWDGALGRQGHRQETSAASAPGSGAQPGHGRTKTCFPQQFPHAGSSRGQSPNQLWLFSTERQPQRGARQGWLQPCSPLCPQCLTGVSPNPPALMMKPCPASAPSWSSHRLLQAGAEPPHGKHHCRCLSQPHPHRWGQCRTCSSSYFSQNLLVKGRQVRYSTQRQFTG